MMLFLISDVSYVLLNQRRAHAESAISSLPSESPLLRNIVVNPLGRSPFNQLHGLGYRNRRRQRHQDVNMVRNTANTQALHTILL